MTAFYSTYRSQRFDDLVGQEAVARTLKNALSGGRVSHAYLFTGIRGTGKTSTARILAKAVNCLEPDAGEPCNRCASCVAIGDASATDLIEIDAASNRGVDEMRDLREKTRYLPSFLKRKVYIIDEAHQLTNEAFNALLKTLEEPPPHVLFVLCTTEAHKLPATVVGRCQRFEFRRIDDQSIAGRLAHIATGEHLECDPAALLLVAAMAQGSMRDAVSMLDQLASSGATRIDEETVRTQLGLVSAARVAGLLVAAARGDAPSALRDLDGMAEAGADLRQLANSLAETARRGVMLHLGAAPASSWGLDQSSQDALRGAGSAAFYSAAFEAALSSTAQMKQAHDPRLVLELLILRLSTRAEKADITPGASVPDAAPVRPPVSPPPSQPAPAGTPGSDSRSSAVAEPSPEANYSPAAKPSTAVAETSAPPVAEPPSALGEENPAPAGAVGPAPSAVSPANSLESVLAGWRGLLDSLRDGAAANRVRALLNEAAPISLEDDLLTIGLRYAFHAEKVAEPVHRQELERALSQVYGRTFRLKLVVGAAPVATRDQAVPAVPAASVAAAPSPANSTAARPAVVAGEAPAPPAVDPERPSAGAAEDVVRAAVDILGARISDVRRREAPGL